MLPIASLLSNPIPPAMTLTPGLAPVLVMLAFLVLGAAEVIRSVRAQRRERRRASAGRSRVSLRPVVPTSKRPLAA